MSSYLNFYLVPWKKEGQGEPKPLFFTSYSRGTAVYDSYRDHLNPVYAGENDAMEELTPDMANSVVNEVRKDLEKARASLEARTETMKELLGTCNKETAHTLAEEFIEDKISTMEYIKELEEGLKQLEGIAEWVNLDSFSSFEKVLINID